MTTIWLQVEVQEGFDGDIEGVFTDIRNAIEDEVAGAKAVSYRVLKS